MTTREKAFRLITIHHGACSVPRNTALQASFQIMQLEGKVTIQDSGTAGFIDVYAKDFQPRFAGKGET